MLHQEKENLIQCGINPSISPEIGRYDMTEIARDVTISMPVNVAALALADFFLPEFLRF